MTITSLLEHPDLWRAGRPGGGGVSHRTTEPCRYPLLDQHLTGGGWPVGAVSELCFNQTGIGELQLLAPALAALSRQRRWIAWLNPPFLPYPPALSALGIQVGRMLLIQPATTAAAPNAGRDDKSSHGNKRDRIEHQRTLWALEQAGRSGACSAVLAWLNERLLTVRDIQRLQVAARRGNTLIWLFRPEAALNQPSLASLRLRLHAAQSPGVELQRLRVDIVKRPGGWPVDGLVLDLQRNPESMDRRRVMELLAFWRSEHQQPALPDAAQPYATPASVQQRAMH
ncbi:MAG: hypothetical protein FJ194_06295 [Gammaproteobacteria bacterium]|nr:hypothetical protein [Gammaproteobacteria bacterium]